MPETPQERLHHSLAELRRLRRKQLSAQQPVVHQLRKSFFLASALLIFVACGFQGLLLNSLEPAFILAFVLAVIGILMPVIAPILVHVAMLFLQVLRIPTILLFETRIHLLELVIIVTLLGNGIGFIIAGTEEATVAETALLSVFCGLLVLGGSAWGLWAATELEIVCTCERCALILGGVLIPAAVLGLMVGPMALIEGLSSPFTVESLQCVCYGVGTAIGSACLFWAIRGYHARASGAFHMKEVRKRAGEIRGHSFPRIRRTTHRLVMERQDD